MCFVDNHVDHRWTDVNKAAVEFRDQLSYDVSKLVERAAQKQLKSHRLDAAKKTFLDKVVSTHSEISQKYGQLISLIQSHQSQLMDELNSFKEKILKKFEIEKVAINEQYAITDSLISRCKTIIKATAYDISRNAHELHSRAEELVMTQDEPGRHQLSGGDITFTSSLSTTDSGFEINFISSLSTMENAKNLIGEIGLEGRISLDSLINRIIICKGSSIYYVTTRGGGRCW